MMLTCSALRCSVLEGSAISGTSDDPGADDPPAPKGIPNAVLYVTVDDETFAHVVRDFEHATDLAFDAPRDVRAGGRRELDRGEVLRPHDVEEARGPAAFRIRGEEAVHVGREHRTVGPERSRQLEHHQVAGANGESPSHVPHDIAEGDRGKFHGGEFEEGGEIHRGHASIVEREDRRRRNRDGGQARPVQGAHDERVQLSHVGLDPSRGGAPGGAQPTLVQSMAAREDVAVRARAVDDQERLSNRRELPREPMNRSRPGRPEMGLFRHHAAAELHEEHDGPSHNRLPLNSFLNIETEILLPLLYPCEDRFNLLATRRLIVWALMLSGILLVSLGLVLAYTWAFPDVTCPGDLGLITWNIFAVPTMLVGTALGIGSVVRFSLDRARGPQAAKH